MRSSENTNSQINSSIILKRLNIIWDHPSLMRGSTSQEASNYLIAFISILFETRFFKWNVRYPRNDTNSNALLFTGCL